jgi:hypothetical protein
VAYNPLLHPPTFHWIDVGVKRVGWEEVGRLGLGEGCFSPKSGSVQWNSHITTQPQTLPPSTLYQSRAASRDSSPPLNPSSPLPLPSDYKKFRSEQYSSTTYLFVSVGSGFTPAHFLATSLPCWFSYVLQPWAGTGNAWLLIGVCETCFVRFLVMSPRGGSIPRRSDIDSGVSQNHSGAFSVFSSFYFTHTHRFQSNCFLLQVIVFECMYVCLCMCMYMCVCACAYVCICVCMCKIT